MRVDEVYPVLAVPQSIRELGPPRDQSQEDAQKVFDWTMSILRDRIDGLLGFFQLDYPAAGSEYPFLLDLGAEVSNALKREPNFRVVADCAEPTAPALSMAYDLGLFVGALVIRSGNGSVQWTLKPGGADIDANQAVLVGRIERLKIEPIRPSIADARLILKGLDLQMMWAWRYVFWSIKLTSGVPLRAEETLSRAHALGFPLEDHREISKREFAKARKASPPFHFSDTSPLAR